MKRTAPAPWAKFEPLTGPLASTAFDVARYAMAASLPAPAPKRAKRPAGDVFNPRGPALQDIDRGRGSYACGLARTNEDDRYSRERLRKVSGL